MFEFTNIPPKELKEFTENGKLDDLLNEILKDFWKLNTEVQYALIKRIRIAKKTISLETIKAVFNCSEKVAFELLNNKSVEVFFPVLNSNKEGKIIKALVIKNTSSILTNLTSQISNLKEIGENFSVFFDNEFIGNSYMLSVSVGVCCDEIPQGLAFTGKVDENGKIYPVGNIKEKEEICKRKGFRLVSPFNLKEPSISYIRNWLTKKVIDIPYYFTTAGNNAEREFNKFLKYANADIGALDVFYGINKNLLIQYSARLEGDKWLEISKEFFKRMSELQYGEKIRYIHIAGRMPSSLSFTFGILFGSQTPFTFYHFQNQEYMPIEIENVRVLKEHINPENVNGFAYKYEEGGNELVILIGSASHTAGGAVKEFMKGDKYTYLLTNHQKRGNLTPEEMVEFARAVNSLIQMLRNDREFKRYHFFFSCPLPVAFMVGVAFGHFSPASIYNYEQDKSLYIEVLRTEELRKIREGKL